MNIYISNGEEVRVQRDCPGEELFILNPADSLIIDKVKQFVSTNQLDYVNKRVKGPSGGKSVFGISSEFVERNPNLVKLYKSTMRLDDDEVKLLTNDKSGKIGRANWYVIKKENIPYAHELFDKYKIVKPTSNTKFELLENNTAFGRSRILMGYFDSMEEATNYFKYLNSVCVQFLVNLTVGTINLGKLVPDMLDYTADNALIDWTKDLDEQLKQLLHLTEDEWSHICTSKPTNE